MKSTDTTAIVRGDYLAFVSEFVLPRTDTTSTFAHQCRIHLADQGRNFGAGYETSTPPIRN